jgi:hypothetical protein
MAPMLRAIGCALPLGAGVLAAGCGASHPATAARSTSLANGSITRAAAIAYAHEVNLSAADVPGAEIGSAELERPKPSQASVEFARCAGAASPERRVVNIKSATFGARKGRNAIEVNSGVEVMPTAALAAQNYDATRSARGRACLKRLLPQVFAITAARRARFGPPTISFLPNLLLTGQESFGARVDTTLVGATRRLPLHFDIFAVLAGPAEVNLTVVAVGRPVSTATERHLLSVLYRRAHAHKL